MIQCGFGGNFDVPVRSVLGGLLNTVLMSATKIGGSDLIFGGKAGVGGLLRELSRLSVLVGLAILLIGLVRRK